MIKTIVSNDVQFYWLAAPAEFQIDDEETHEVLLTEVVQELLLLIGFSKARIGWKNLRNQLKSLHNVLEIYKVNYIVMILMNSVIVSVRTKHCTNIIL